MSDYMMWCPTRRIGRGHVSSQRGGPNSTFLYMFSELPGLDGDDDKGEMMDTPHAHAT
eukprot:COSAG01_NODE_5993_length_3911_cov_1.807450_4_plen_58_part_00